MAATLLLVLAFWKTNSKIEPTPPSTPLSPKQQDPPHNGPVASSADEERFVRDVLPVVTDFVRRVELSGIKMPFTGPITPKRLSLLTFGKNIHIFVVERRAVFQYHNITRSGQRHVGIHSLNLTGTDADGAPLNVDALLTNPARYAHVIEKLADQALHPSLDLGVTRDLARGLVSNMRPGVAYDNGKQWQDAVASTRLPFYNHIFERAGQPTDNPANVFTDSVNVILKSTADGLVLQHYEDLGIAFLR